MLVDEYAQKSLKSLTMPQGRESTGYLRLKRVPSENSLILPFTLSKRITRITETSPFLSPLLKVKFRHCSQSKKANSLLSFSALVNTFPLTTSNRLESTKCCQRTFCGGLTAAENRKESKIETASVASMKQC